MQRFALRLPQGLAQRAMASMAGPIQRMLEERIRTNIAGVQHLEIVNESHKHAGGAGAESHFKLFVVSPAFDGVALVERHRMVNAAVKAPGEVDIPVHALSISAKTPAQWAAGAQLQSTPNCAGGHK